MEDDRTAQVAAAVCELAVAKTTNRYWHAHIWHATEHHKFKNLPDVGRNIEVRRVRTSKRAAVRRHQLGKGLVLFVAYALPPELREVDVLGWVDMDTAWEVGEPPYWDEENSRVVSPEHLTPWWGDG
jgi:hypothetical protein